MLYFSRIEKSFSSTASFPSISGSLYLHDPRNADGVLLRSARSCESLMWSFRSTMSSLRSPSIPQCIPYIFFTPASLAASMTPARLELITAVGPPDCPTIKFPFTLIFFTLYLLICLPAARMIRAAFCRPCGQGGRGAMCQSGAAPSRILRWQL